MTIEHKENSWFILLRIKSNFVQKTSNSNYLINHCFEKLEISCFGLLNLFLPELGLIKLLFHKTLSHLLAVSQINFGMRISDENINKWFCETVFHFFKQYNKRNFRSQLSTNKIQWNWNTPIKIFVIDAGLIKLFFHKHLSHRMKSNFRPEY